jgi:iron complex outermembrane recepter protein
MKFRPTFRWLCLLGSILAAFGLSPVIAQTTESSLRRFDLPDEAASKSLKLFSEQAGIQVLVPLDRVKGVRTNAVHGEFTPADALERMVAGTELRVLRDKATGALGVKRLVAVDEA